VQKIISAELASGTGGQVSTGLRLLQSLLFSISSDSRGGKLYPKDGISRDFFPLS
jgi:hypothetical protein